MKITVELPEDAYATLRRGPQELANELRLAASIKWYELGRVSQAKAAELAGLSRSAFIEALRAYQVPAVQDDASSLEESVAN
ncbi:MAG: UPF0175 family protein [Verrucomicrobiota bacterium]